MDFVNRWHDRTKLPATRFIRRLGIGSSQFYRWRERYGMVKEHNGKVSRDFWLLDGEKQALKGCEHGYRTRKLNPGGVRRFPLCQGTMNRSGYVVHGRVLGTC
jgi:hypothetical protein